MYSQPKKALITVTYSGGRVEEHKFDLGSHGRAPKNMEKVLDVLEQLHKNGAVKEYSVRQY